MGTTLQLPPPLRVLLNEHNISDGEKALLDAYRYDDPNSLYAQVEKSPFWGIMHDGITKFQKEYYCCFLRILDQDNSPVAVPYGLTNVPGGVTGLDTGN